MPLAHLSTLVGDDPPPATSRGPWRLERRTIGALYLPSGRIAIAHFPDGDQRIAAAWLAVSDTPPVRWTNATLEGQPADADAAYGVDSGRTSDCWIRGSRHRARTGPRRVPGGSSGSPMPARRFPEDILAAIRWAVVVERRVFVRSWSLKPRSWYRTFLTEPAGAIEVEGREAKSPATITELVPAAPTAYS